MVPGAWVPSIFLGPWGWTGGPCRCGFRLYERLEADGKGRKTIKAQHLWFRILEAQMETGNGGRWWTWDLGIGE